MTNVEDRGLLAEVEMLHVDRGYDNGVVRRLIAAVGKPRQPWSRPNVMADQWETSISPP